MITGVVTADREAVMRLSVRGPTAQEHEIEAVIDTGFDGSLGIGEWESRLPGISCFRGKPGSKR